MQGNASVHLVLSFACLAGCATRNVIGGCGYLPADAASENEGEEGQITHGIWISGSTRDAAELLRISGVSKRRACGSGTADQVLT